MVIRITFGSAIHFAVYLFPQGPPPHSIPVMAAAWVGIALIVLGFWDPEASFSASSWPDGAGWVWLPGGSGQAQWQFCELSGEGQYLSVELLVHTQGWPASPPEFFSLTLRFSTFGAALTRKIQVQRVRETGKMVAYFGQLILARRELGFGSYLCVHLSGGPSGVEIGVHPDSLRILGERFSLGPSAAGGAGGPLVLPARPQASSAPLSELRFRECAGPKDSPYLSPGRYAGELGWSGPGSPVDDKDWLRVNLNQGHLLELRVSTPKPVTLVLLDPSGQEVGRVKGSGQIGLTYQALVRGAYAVLLSITEGVPVFTYTLEISLRR